MIVRSLFAAIALCATPAAAQDYSAMINQQMAQMNAMINQGNQQINGWVQQKMQDPQVQAGYRAYVAKAQAQGLPVQDFPTWTYNYIYTNGYSAEGMAAARQNETRNQQKEMQAYNALRSAEQNRAAAQGNLQNHYSANQQEAGNQLAGNSTYYAPNGQPMVLPHTWQANTTNYYNGAYYHVDPSGAYYVYAADGNWYPLKK